MSFAACFLVFLLSSFAPLPAAAQVGQAAIFRNIQIKCGICHTDRMIAVSEQGGINFKAFKEERAGKEGLCYSCHNGIVKDSRGMIWMGFQHPSGIRPGQNEATIRKQGFPLDEEGKLFCGSCHTPHARAEGIKLFMRFKAEEGQFCQKCHPTRGLGPKYGEHPLDPMEKELPRELVAAGAITGRGQKIICATCHRIHGAQSPFLLVLRPWDKDGLCQNCHGLNPSQTGVGFGNGSHPINIRLQESVKLKWSRDSVVTSPAGMVDCWSCHRTHRTTGGSKLLIRDMERGNGCGHCHEKERSFVRSKGNHPVTAEGGSDEGEGRDRVTCRVCHRAHNSFSKESHLLSYDRGRHELCQGCHAERTEPERNHPIEIFGKGDLLGKLEDSGALLVQGKILTCATCHRSHGAIEGTAAMVVEEKALCLYCHQRENYLDAKKALPGTHPILVPAGERIPQEVISAGGRLGPQREIICTTCHRVHGYEKGSGGLVMDKESLSCTFCHKEYVSMVDGAHNLALTRPEVLNKFGENVYTSGLCRACHTEHGWAREIPGGEEDLLTRLCLSCHSAEGMASTRLPQDVSHPRGIKVSEGVAEGLELPLYLKDGRPFKKGRISCATCHDVHNGKDNDATASLRLPMNGEKALCTQCHLEERAVIGTKHDLTVSAPDEVNLWERTPSQGGICSSCHMAHGGLERTMWARFLDGQGDQTSQFCRSCHFPGFSGGRKVVGPFSHPVGKGGGEPGREKVLGCTSCHDPHRWNSRDFDDRGGKEVEGTTADSFLRWADDYDSYLCLQCHPEKGRVAGTKHDLRTGPPGGPSVCSPMGRNASLCGNCHLPHGGQAFLGWPRKLPGKEETISRICGFCHIEGGCAQNKQPGLYFHPIRVSTKDYRPGPLPLFDEQGGRRQDGFMTCATCHDVHLGQGSADAGKGVLTGQGGAPFLRRRSSGASPLCAECHREESLISGTDHDLRVTDPQRLNGSGRKPSESGVCGVCHGNHNLSYDFYLWNRPLGPGRDIITRLCTGCHAGQGGAGQPHRYYVHYRSGRMMDVDSARTTFTLKRGSWVETRPLLPLYTGEGYTTSHGFITCATCHDVHRWDPAENTPGSGIAQEGNKGNSFLRLKGSFAILNTFCVDCHTDDAINRYQNFHFPQPEESEGN